MGLTVTPVCGQKKAYLHSCSKKSVFSTSGPVYSCIMIILKAQNQRVYNVKGVFERDDRIPSLKFGTD